MTHRLKIVGIFVFLSAIFFGMVTLSLHAASRGIVVNTKDPSGSAMPMQLYSGYHALVVGCSDYRAGWPKLPNPVVDAREVAATLKDMDWDVELLEDPGWDRLDDALNRLVTGPGREKDKAVLFWFSGHGHTLGEADDTRLGYIVPVDAPLPSRDEIGFMRRAIDMRQIETVVKRIRAKHVLMMFDSCFSGAIFSMVRAAPSDYIEEKIAAPVREFITAGREDEEVPDRSVFKTCFIQGIQDGYADANRDGYVTGEELGAYLQEKVINYSRKAQHPQFGKINNPKLDKGDFVFALNNPKAISPSTGLTSEPAVNKKAVEEKGREALKAGPAEGKAQLLANIPKEVHAPHVSLRKGGDSLSATDINKMLVKHNFFDSERNEDGHFANHLVDNGDNTVSDKATGLVWQKAGSAHKLSWHRAIGYVNKLNKQKFAGYSTWRLPTIEEFASLSANQKTRGHYTRPLFDTRQKTCWSVDLRSATLPHTSYTSRWIMDFSNGKITYALWSQNRSGLTSKSADNYVRVVRPVE